MMLRRMNRSLTLAAAALFVLIAPINAWAQEKTLPHFRFDAPIMETQPEFLALFGQESPRVLRTIIERIDQARDDEDVPAMILTVDASMMGRAQLEEISDALHRFRDGGKNIHCYLEFAGMGEYALASTATDITLMPTGPLLLPGMFAEAMYFKGTLDKIGVEADVIQMGDYKSAGEMFTRTGPSEEAEQNLNWLIDGLYDQFIGRMATGRGFTADQMKRFIDHGIIDTDKALELKLVDRAEYRPEFLQRVKKLYGGEEEVEIDSKYGLKKMPEIDFSNPLAIFQFLGDLLKATKEPKKPCIAVITLEGMILPGKSTDSPLLGKIAGSRTIAKAFEQAREDDKVKAVVFRIDSPGGSGLASEVILHASERLCEEKPLVVSMGNVAGSGGYWVAIGGTVIYADPSTITGSIGVLSGKFVMKGLWEKLGFTTHEYTRGKFANLFNSTRGFTDEQRELITGFIEQAYEEFKERVKKSRGDRLKDDLENLAGGRVYTGAQAVENGLVDKLGGLDDAVKEAARLAHITKYEIITMPKPRSFFDLILEDLGMGDDDVSSADALSGLVGQWYLDQSSLAALQKLAPEQLQAAGRMLLRVHLIRTEGVVAAMPYELIIR